MKRLLFLLGATAFCSYPFLKLELPSIIGFFLMLWAIPAPKRKCF